MTSAHPMMTVPVRAEGQAAAGARQGIHFTMVLATGTNPAGQLLPRDPDRVEAWIQSVDEPIVLAQNREMAENPANQAASVPAPVGAYLPAAQWVTLRHCDEVWAAATSATATRVTVIVSRRLPGEHPALP